MIIQEDDFDSDYVPSNASDNKQQHLNSNRLPSTAGFPTTRDNSADDPIEISSAEASSHYDTTDEEDVPETSTRKETLSSLMSSSSRDNLQSALTLLS